MASMKRARRSVGRIGWAQCRSSRLPEQASKRSGVSTKKFSRLTSVISTPAREGKIRSSSRTVATPPNPPPSTTIRIVTSDLWFSTLLYARRGRWLDDVQPHHLAWSDAIVLQLLSALRGRHSGRLDPRGTTGTFYRRELFFGARPAGRAVRPAITRLRSRA